MFNLPEEGFREVDYYRLKAFFDAKVLEYENPEFIPLDPICIPHQYSKLQDVEISGFFAAMLAWGQRPMIIKKSLDLLQRMDNAPYDFVLHHSDEDLKPLLGFKHRTFNATDLLYFVAFFRWFYSRHTSLEEAFLPAKQTPGHFVEAAISRFHELFFSLPDSPQRTRKHVATPQRKSACKRINMYLRWMVRSAEKGVDFGLWRKIRAADLVCPCDVHVGNVARRVGFITRKQNDWRTATELTNHLRRMDPSDPVKYDFALFGLGVFEK